MRYRPLSPSGDYTIGVPFLTGAAATAQAILTRLKLWQGEWFLNTADGTPWQQQILGHPPNSNVDALIKQRILGTPDVTAILQYSSSFNPVNRKWSINCLVKTDATVVVAVAIANFIVPPPPAPSVVTRIATDAGINIATDSGLDITTDN